MIDQVVFKLTHFYLVVEKSVINILIWICVLCIIVLNKIYVTVLEVVEKSVTMQWP